MQPCSHALTHNHSPPSTSMQVTLIPDFDTYHCPKHVSSCARTCFFLFLNKKLCSIIQHSNFYVKRPYLFIAYHVNYTSLKLFLFLFSKPKTQFPKYWSFSFSISPSNEYTGLISFRMDQLDLLAVQGTES